MRRREFIMLLGGVSAARATPANAQEPASRTLSRVAAHVAGRNVGIITAANNLRHDIKADGLGFLHVRSPTDEHLLLVIGKKGYDSGHLVGFLKKHEDVLHKAHDSDEVRLLGTRVSLGKFQFAFEGFKFYTAKSFFSRKE